MKFGNALIAIQAGYSLRRPNWLRDYNHPECVCGRAGHFTFVTGNGGYAGEPEDFGCGFKDGVGHFSMNDIQADDWEIDNEIGFDDAVKLMQHGLLLAPPSNLETLPDGLPPYNWLTIIDGRIQWHTLGSHSPVPFDSVKGAPDISKKGWRVIDFPRPMRDRNAESHRLIQQYIEAKKTAAE